MGRARWLWVLIPCFGLAEFGAALYDSKRAPRVQEWEQLRATVARLKRAGDLVVVAPRWAEPLARHALGDTLMPIVDVARADLTAYAGALELSALGADDAELAGWPVRRELGAGRFRIRLRDNPKQSQVRYLFLDHARPPELSAFEVGAGKPRDCPYTDHARVTAGGLHGHVTFPRQRFACAGGEDFFVGLTIIDDQEYRPRRCLFAHPARSGALVLRFSDVPMGSVIHGYAGVPYFIYRDGLAGPVVLSARVDGEPIGQAEHRDEWGWHGFEFKTERFAGRTATVEFEVRSSEPNDRQFCFYADTR